MRRTVGLPCRQAVEDGLHAMLVLPLLQELDYVPDMVRSILPILSFRASKTIQWCISTDFAVHR